MKGTIRKYFLEVPALARMLKTSGALSAGYLILKFWWFLLSRKCFYGEKKMNFRLKFNGNDFMTTIYNNTDFLTFRTAYLFQDYLVPELSNPNLIVDAGANVGFVAQYLRAKYPNTKIICIEPIKENFNKLKENIGNDSNIVLVNKALGKIDGTQVFSVSSEYSFSASYRNRTLAQNKEEVEVVSLDTFFKEFEINKVDLFKFDIEGAEDQVFIEESDIIKSEYYAGEVHGDLMDISVDEFLSRFSSYKITTRSLGQDRAVFKGVKIN